MAAPTDARVEAIAPTSTVVRWTYGGANSIQVHRSTDGSAYAVTGDPVVTGTTIFTDVGLAADTKYWYKLSDDAGSTFSSVVTVVTHDCQDDGGAALTQGVNLPRGTTEFDDAMRRIEDAFNRDDLQGSEPCSLCVDSEGKVVIDCASGCQSFEIDVDVDVSSITIKNCKEFPVVDWNCPADKATDCGIGGWPADSPFGGDEGFKALLQKGRTMTTGGGGRNPRSKPGAQKRRPSGGGVGGSTCECVPSQTNTLSIKCCTSNCSLSCSGSKSLSIKVCGGKGPYTIVGSGSINVKRQNGNAVGSGTITAGESINITPPTNSGSGVAGTAYTKVANYCSQTLGGGCAGATVNSIACADFNCNDVNTGFTTQADIAGAQCGCTEAFENAAGCLNGSCAQQCSSGPCSGVSAKWTTPDDPVVGNMSTAGACDRRTAPMIAAGCNPCGVSVAAQTITVTDSLGNSVVKTLNA